MVAMTINGHEAVSASATAARDSRWDDGPEDRPRAPSERDEDDCRLDVDQVRIESTDRARRERLERRQEDGVRLQLHQVRRLREDRPPDVTLLEEGVRLGSPHRPAVPAVEPCRRREGEDAHREQASPARQANSSARPAVPGRGGESEPMLGGQRRTTRQATSSASTARRPVESGLTSIPIIAPTDARRPQAAIPATGARPATVGSQRLSPRNPRHHDASRLRRP